MDTGGTQLLTQWRQVAGGAYVYLYNPADDQVSVAPSFEVNGVPSELDLWDGSITPVAQYSNAKRRTTVPMTLDPHEVKVLAFDAKATPSVHVVDPVAPADGELVTDGDRILFRTSESGQRSFKLSNGRDADGHRQRRPWQSPKRPAQCQPSVAARSLRAVDAQRPDGHPQRRVDGRGAG